MTQNVLHCVFCEVQRLNAAMAVNAEPSLKLKHCPNMPVYPATLQHISSQSRSQ